MTEPIRYRSGWPSRCPLTGQKPTFAHCRDQECQYNQIQCRHPEYQVPGEYWCKGCGRELTANHIAHGWPHYCGGLIGRCLEDVYKEK